MCVEDTLFAGEVVRANGCCCCYDDDGYCLTGDFSACRERGRVEREI